MPFCVVFLWRLYHYERKWGTTTIWRTDSPTLWLYHYERKWGTTTRNPPRIHLAELYHYERKWGTTTRRGLTYEQHWLYHYERKWGTTTVLDGVAGVAALYHYERKWGTMVFAPMPKNDFLHIISPFSACVNPQTEGAGVAKRKGPGLPVAGGLWHILDKRGNLG